MKFTLKPLGRIDIPQSSISILTTRKELPGLGFFPVISKIQIDGKYDENLVIFLKVKKNTQVESCKCGTIANPLVPNEDFIRHWVSNDLGFTYFIQLICPMTSKVMASMKSPKSINDDSKDNKDDAPIGTRFTDTAPRLWNLKLSEGEKPIIEISNEIENQNFILGNLIFLNSVLPESIYRVGNYLLDNRHNLDEEGWFKDWLELFKKLNINDFEDIGEEDNDKEEWLNTLVSKYCEKFKPILYTKLISDLNSGAEEDE